MRQTAAMILLTLFMITAGLPAQIHEPETYEEAIGNFLEEDQANPPEPGGILFLGSSSIRMWDLEKWFPEMNTLNRGYGGSYISDSIYYADRILLPYRPRTVVFYAGDNDLAAGKDPKEVFADYKEMASIISEKLPKTEFIFIAIKPSIARFNLIEDIRWVNRKIMESCRGNPHLHFLDIDGPMLGDDGKPDPSLFLEDGLHMNEEGYRIWSSMLRPLLE